MMKGLPGLIENTCASQCGKQAYDKISKSILKQNAQSGYSIMTMGKAIRSYEKIYLFCRTTVFVPEYVEELFSYVINPQNFRAARNRIL